MKLINSSPAPGDCHGCPFRHNDVQSLKQTFMSQNLSPTGNDFEKRKEAYEHV